MPHHGLMLLLTMTAPSPAPEFTPVPEARRWVNEDSLYADVMNRCPKEPVFRYDRTTNAHETNHHVDAGLSDLDRRHAFYVLRGRAVAMRPARLAKSQVAASVPEGMRGTPYQNYVLGGTGHDQVRDVLEEWNAHVNEMEVALEDDAAGRPGHWPSCYAAVELGVISCAFAREIQRRDPEYWEHEPQFRRFVSWQWDRMLRLLAECRRVPRFYLRSTEDYVATLNSAPDGGLRAWIRDELGKEPTKEVSREKKDVVQEPAARPLVPLRGEQGRPGPAGEVASVPEGGQPPLQGPGREGAPHRRPRPYGGSLGERLRQAAGG